MTLSDRAYKTISELLAETRDKGGRYVEAPEFVVDGYPRSANTFLVTALNLSWPNMSVKSHGHDSKHLSAADGLVPVVSVIRNPVDAIASYAVHLSLYDPDRINNLDLLIGLYGDMSKQALDNPHVLAIPFEEVVSDVAGTLDLLESKYALKNRVRVSPEEILSQTQDLSKRVNLDKEAFTKMGHVPRDKDPVHAEVLAKLQGPEHERVLSRLTKLYNSVIAQYYSGNK
jgi:hypothetical protein